MAGQAAWVELTLPSCCRESCEVRYVVRDSASTHMKSLASMLKVNGANCESPQDLGGGWENLTSNQVKGPNCPLIFTLLRDFMRFHLRRNPANSFMLVQPSPIGEAEAGVFLGRFLKP